MTTQAQLESKITQQRGELAGIENELSASRAALRKNTSDKEAAKGLAASIMVLEARREALKAEIEAAQQQAEKQAALVNSKEYLEALKEIADIEAVFRQEAAAARREIFALHARAKKILDKHPHFAKLIQDYCIDLDNLQKAGRKNNPAYLQLLSYFKSLNQTVAREQDIEAIKRPAKIVTNTGIEINDGKPKYYTPNA